jgi:hypothetical protein
MSGLLPQYVSVGAVGLAAWLMLSAGAAKGRLVVRQAAHCAACGRRLTKNPCHCTRSS